MEGVLAGVMNLAFSRKAEENDQKKKLLDQIEDVRQTMNLVTARFDFQEDPDLVEECIYEMQALAARYRYLTREARRQGITCELSLNLMQVDG